jgi:microcystin-dependent protein
MVKILSDVSLSTSTDDLTVGGTIELGHATDTTLSRSAAGTLAVEGVDVSLSTHTHGALMPTGSVAMWMTATAPTGWLFLDGSTISQATYPALAAVFGVGSGTFALPDMRDRFAAGRSDTALGWANNAGTFAPNTGNIHSHTTNIAHAHADTIAVSTHGDHTHTTDPAAVTSGAASGTTFPMGTSTTNPFGAHTHSVNVAATASGTESTNLTHTVTGGVTSLGATSVTSSDGTISPKATLLNFIIKT